MTLWKDVIDIPTEVHRGDFVLKLAEGLERGDQTVATYVVTPELARAFETALSLIRAALDGSDSKGAYLHGSFGAGKSHFMAVLNLLLQGNTKARSLPGLAASVDRHRWMESRRLLMVPYHLLGARDLESALFGGYVEHVRKLHPESPLPGVYVADRLFDNARQLRSTIGDEAFFGMLGGEQGPWGELEAGWDATRFEAAIESGPSAPERSILVGELVAKVFPSMSDLARAGGELFVGIDEGMGILSRHARDLGYDGLILFLDELILWLLSRAGDLNFVHREQQKIAKLVESQDADRPVPIISFIAQQRDLSEYVGGSGTGAERDGLAQSLKWTKERFDTIVLEDRNLRAIAHERILKVTDPGDRERVRQAFDGLVGRMRVDDRDHLLTRDADVEQFRLVFPFSPALVEALVALSAVLQRERTALRLMQQLLVDNREVLALGDVIPVGDLWDVVAAGDEPFSDTMRAMFDDARRLYAKKLRPALVSEVGFDPEIPEHAAGRTEAQFALFRSGDRLIKTLLLGSLVDVPSLRNLTASKLQALNYGAVRASFKGGEDREVARRLRAWAGQVGELRFEGGSLTDLVSIHLSQVDLEPILERVSAEDNESNRRKKVRELLFDALGIPSGSMMPHKGVPWRGSDRTVEVLYTNVRDLQWSGAKASPDTWRVVIDYPFDDHSYSPRDDEHRVAKLLEEHPEGTATLVWLPAFLSDAGRQELGKLVVLEHLLQGDRLAKHTEHLAPSERPTLRTQAENQRSALVARVRQTLLVAYGLSGELIQTVDVNHAPSRRLWSMHGGFTPRMPAVADFGEALDGLVRAAYEATMPDAPRLPDVHLTPRKLQGLYETISKAIEHEDDRYYIEKRADRDELREIVQPLRVGEMGADHWVRSRDWRPVFGSLVGSDRIAVSDLREALDPPTARRGLSAPLQNFVLLAFAEAENYGFVLHGQPCTAELRSIPDDAVLERRAVPDEAEWAQASARAAELFGISAPRVRSAKSAQRFAHEVTAKVSVSADAARSLPALLEQAGERVGLTPEQVRAGARYRTAAAVKALVEGLASDPTRLVKHLATCAIETSAAAMARSLTTCRQVVELVRREDWDGLHKGLEWPDPQVQSLVESAQERWCADEYVSKLDGLGDLNRRARDLIYPVRPPDERRRIVSSSDVDALAEWLRAEVEAGRRFEVSVRELGSGGGGGSKT